MQMIAPLDLLELTLGREFEDLLASLEIGDHSSVVFATTDNKAWVRETPSHREDTFVVDVIEGATRIFGITQVPNID